jgi:hypothetical protein
LVRVKGVDADSFLQGLMTNDISELEAEVSRSLYCMFLNTGGRQEQIQPAHINFSSFLTPSNARILCLLVSFFLSLISRPCRNSNVKLNANLARLID